MRLFITVLIAALSLPVLAGVGARPMGMGGAFIGLADDANDTYWNPAALPLQSRQATGMLTLDDDGVFKSFLSYSQPISKTVAVGISRVGFNDVSLPATPFTPPMRVKRSYFAGSVGVKVAEGWYAGAIIKEHHLVVNAMGQSTTAEGGFGVDLSVYHPINEKWSAGLLIQDVNEPEEKINGATFLKWQRNIRPGVAYRVNDAITATADIYDLTDDTALCIGAEKRLNDKWTVRGGLYRLGGEEGNLVTLGGSYRVNDRLSVDAVLVGGIPVISATVGL